MVEDDDLFDVWELPEKMNVRRNKTSIHSSLPSQEEIHAVRLVTVQTCHVCVSAGSVGIERAMVTAWFVFLMTIRVPNSLHLFLTFKMCEIPLEGKKRKPVFKAKLGHLA